MQIDHEDRDFVNPLLEVGRTYLLVRMAMMMLSAVFFVVVILLALVTDLVLRYPFLTGAAVVGTVLFFGGLGIALYLREKGQERRWKAAQLDGGKALYVDPTDAFVCSVCASRGGPGEECAKHPGGRLDSRDEDNRYAITQALNRSQTQRAAVIIAAVSAVPILVLSVMVYIITLPCPWGAYNVDERGGMLAGQAWCEDGEGLKHGDEIHYNAVGTRIARIPWEHGQQHGTEVHWHEDGTTVLLEQTWVDGGLHGASMAYYPSGRLKTDAAYAHGEPVGVHLGFWDSGERRSEARYEGGVLVGEQREWYVDGRPASEASFLEGAPHGKQTRYTKRGEIELERHYARGVLNGPYIKNSKRGDLVQRGTYDTGEKTGEWVEREETGVYRRGRYQAGKRVGTWQTTGRSGVILLEETWVDDLRQGPSTAHHPDGSLAAIGTYEDGEKQGIWLQFASTAAWALPERPRPDLGGFPPGMVEPRDASVVAARLGVERVEWPADTGPLLSAGRYVAGKQDGLWLRWYDNGWPQSERSWKLGEKHGPVILWSEEGRGMTVGAHTEGKRSGRWTETLPPPSGRTPSVDHWVHEGSYADGHKEGHWKAFAAGALIYEAHWVGGLKNGMQTQYDLQGREIEQGPYKEGLAEGRFKTWRKGELVEEAGFKAGYYHGVQTRYQQGTVVSQVRWEMGEQVN